LGLFILILVDVCIGGTVGVSPNDLEKYSKNSFNCDQKSIPIAYVNDDYCDCLDGTDEPGTSACVNGKFYCANKGHKPEILPASRVKDGICDCCDGSDEHYSSSCPNNCKELSLVHVKELKEKIQRYIKGIGIKDARIKQGVAILEDKNRQVTQKEAELEVIMNKSLPPLEEKVLEIGQKRDKKKEELKSLLLQKATEIAKMELEEEEKKRLEEEEKKKLEAQANGTLIEPVQPVVQQEENKEDPAKKLEQRIEQKLNNLIDEHEEFVNLKNEYNNEEAILNVKKKKKKISNQQSKI